MRFASGAVRRCRGSTALRSPLEQGRPGIGSPETINLQCCNGINGGDYWGVFGNDPASADGFQADFTGTDFPDIYVSSGCNVEFFAVGGIRIQSPYIRAFIGANIDRSGLATAYDSLVRARVQSDGTGTPIQLSGSLSKGSGVPNGGAALTTGWLIGHSCYFQDLSGLVVAGGVTTSYDAGAALFYPVVIGNNIRPDVFQDNALNFSAIQARRLSISMQRYNTPAALTPVGSHQTIDVTGFTKVTVTPAAGSDIDKATFTTTPERGTGPRDATAIFSSKRGMATSRSTTTSRGRAGSG